MRRAFGALPSPLWGGGVGGGGHEIGAPPSAIRTTPLPSPPPQGGREQTEFALADSTAHEYAVAPLDGGWPQIGSSTPTTAAVHIDRVRGHEGARIRAHEQHQFADFLRLPKTFHRHVIQKPLHQFRRRLRRALETACGPARAKSTGSGSPPARIHARPRASSTRRRPWPRHNAPK